MNTVGLSDQAIPLTIIIPVWNGEDYIGRCLESLKRQTVPITSAQVIVVDNGSTDSTPRIVKEFEFVELWHQPVPGSYSARNLGLEKAKAEFVLFTDADCVAAPDWLERALHLASFARDLDIFAGQIKLFREPGAGKVIAKFEELTAFNQASNVSYGFAVTANLLCHKGTLLKFGAFDGNLLSGGDVETTKRLVSNGCRLKYEPELLVSHPTRAGLLSMLRKQRRVTGGKWALGTEKGQGLLALLRQDLAEALKRARWMIREPMPATMKMGIISVLFVLALTSQLEMLRLAVGANPYRN